MKKTDLISLPQIDGLKRAETIDDSADNLPRLLKEHKLSLDEYDTLLSILERTPTFAELGVFSAMWSEHCSYKSSRVHLKRFPTKGKDVIQGPGENAGIVRLHGKLCLAFKMESHNHPSYLEPYQGAATGVGGILRDVFCMGSRPIANLNCLRFGEKSHPRTQYLVEKVVKGIGDYGNCVGIPTVGGNIDFNETYNGNCLVNAMTIGVIHEDKIFKGYASGEGNLILYVGSATGRDGIHGATMASDSFASGQNQSKSTVQVGDPFTEKILLEITLDLLEKGLVVGLQDMGAAGLTSSAFEMASRAGNGIQLDLDQVPIRTQNLTAYELLLSESQERMVMVIKPENWSKVLEVLEKWQLSYALIGKVTKTGRVQISYQGTLEVDVPVSHLTDKAPCYRRPTKKRSSSGKMSSDEFEQTCATSILAKGIENTYLELIGMTGDKTWIFDQYDHHIGTMTVLGPKEDTAAVMWIRSDLTTDKPYLGMVTAAACNEMLCAVDPRKGASYAVLKAARMISAAGGKPLAITDCLNFGNPENEEVMWEFSEAVDGISEACLELDAPVVSGNVSLYNQTDGCNIFPTPMIGMVGKMEDVRTCTPGIIKEPTNVYLLLQAGSEPTFTGSAVSKVLKTINAAISLPDINWSAEKEAQEFLRENSGLLASCRDVGSGGIATCISKMCMAGDLGLEIDLCQIWSDLRSISEEASIRYYFGELQGAYLLCLNNGKENQLFKSAETLKHNHLYQIGRTIATVENVNLGPWKFSRSRAKEKHRLSFNLET